SQSGLITPLALVALALCSCGVLLGMLSLAATPPMAATGANVSRPADMLLAQSFQGTVDRNANGRAAVATLTKEALPPGVPLPPGAQFSFNRQGDPSNSSPTAGFPAVAGMPLRPSLRAGALSKPEAGLDAPQGAK